MERITNVRISTLTKVVPLETDITVTSVAMSGTKMVVVDADNNTYELGTITVSNACVVQTVESHPSCGSDTSRANVIANLLRGVDGKDGKDGKTQDLSEYYKKSEVDDKLKQKQDTISNLDTIRANAEKGATAVQPSELAKVATSGNYNDLSDKPHIPAEVTEQKVRDWGFTKNTGTYSKPASGIPKTDLASDVQTSLGKAETALQSYTEQYTGTVTGVKINGSTKNPSNGVVDLGTVITEHQDIAGIEGEITASKLAQRLSWPSEDNPHPLATVRDLASKTDIIASQIFLELHTDFDDFQVFSHKRGYEEHNREVCQRLIENCFSDKRPNNEMFFVTINGMRDGVPYMETAILESQVSEVVRASFVKGNIAAQGVSIAASIGVLGIDAEGLRSYAESGADLFYWKYFSIQVPSIDAIGSEGESDVYVTEFTFEQITTNGTAVKVSPELVSAIYNKRIIVIPSSMAENYIATNTFSNRPLAPVNIRMQIASGRYIYDVTLNGKGAAPQSVPTRVNVTRLLSGTLNTINGASIASGVDMPLVSSISLNGKTYTPTKGAVDLGEIEVDEVKFANDLTGVVEATPEMFTFRPSAGEKSVRDESAVIRRIKGNSAIFSQSAGYVKNRTYKGITIVHNNNGVVELSGELTDGATVQSGYLSNVYGHKYLIVMEVLSMGDAISFIGGNLNVATDTFKEAGKKWKIATSTRTSNLAYIGFYNLSGSANGVKFRFQQFDLTDLFGAGNEPTTYDEFRQYYPNEYYPYCEPEVRSMRATGIETIGFNAFNGEYAEVIGGQPYYLGGAIDTAHFATEVGGESLEVTIPENRLYTPSENGYIYATGSDICINLSHSGVRNGEYKPYEKNTLLLPEIAKYFPNGMHGIGDVYDEINEELAIQRCDVRAYEEGDENNAEVKTDKITTVYKLSEPIYTPIDEPLQLAYKVDDFGTEKMLTDKPSTPFKADITYGFNAEGRIRDNSRNIERLENNIIDIRDGADKGKTSVQSITINGESKTPDENGIVDLGNVQKGIVDVEDPTIDVLEPNKIYVYATSTISSITINSFSTTDALTEEYVVQFRTFPLAGSITLPSGVMWANGVTPTLEGDTLYELSIVKTHIGETDYFKAVLTPFK